VVELTHDSRPIIGRGPPLTAYFIALAAASIGLMVADQKYQQIDRVREVLSAAVHPVQRAVDFPFRATDWVVESFADRGRLRQDNLELMARLRLANLQLQRFAALEDENRRLRDMRANTTGIAEKVLVASIMNVDLDPFRHRVLLDKGALDGVFRGQAVLDGEGIFGQVTKVNAATSEVILISDPEHAIPVQSNRSGVRTIAVGTGDLNKLSLPFVTAESDIQKDDLLLSTGMGGVFPPGYPVGQVSKVKRSGQTFALIEARPTARLDRDREVLLVWFKPPPSPTAEAKATTPAGAPAPTGAAAGKPGTGAATATKPGGTAAPAAKPAANPQTRLPAAGTTKPTAPAPTPAGAAPAPNATTAAPAPATTPPPNAGDG
jgi:rod shape-determining protein MreC